MTQPALKEWSASVHALLEGRQTVLLRKGGIHEKRFAVTASRFLLFPTVAHSHAERVRPNIATCSRPPPPIAPMTRWCFAPAPKSSPPSR